MYELINNRYQIKHKIGSGGMADVYLALDTVLNREVAIKILRGDLTSDPVSVIRFQREAHAISSVNHPNIVQVYDVGETDDTYYIVMEYLKGITLKQLIHRRGALEPKEAVGLMIQLSLGLQEAHLKNVIHRDIKPQNILIEDDGTVKLTDFGIAIAGDALQLTKMDSVLGSVHYMAPECSRGEGASMQSDIYALGVVFYELLTGFVPYQGENAVEIAMKHLRDPFPSVLDVNPQLPNAVANIISRATAKQKSIRYLNIEDLLNDLMTCLDLDRANEPLFNPALALEATSSDETQTKKTINKKRALIMGGIVFVVIACLGVYLATRPKRPKNTEVPEAIIGMNINDIEAFLEEHHLMLDDRGITYKYSETHEKDLVTDVSPKVGSLVPAGKHIKVTVSLGKMFEVEDYVGKTTTEVERLLTGYNVRIRIESRTDVTVEPGRVIEQLGLKPGDLIEPTTRYEMTLVVSAAAADIIPTSIVGKTLSEAEAMLTAMHFQVSKEKLSLNGLMQTEIDKLSYGTVVRTNPTVGSYYKQEEGKHVVLYYYDEADKPEPVETPTTPSKPDGDN